MASHESVVKGVERNEDLALLALIPLHPVGTMKKLVLLLLPWV